MLFQVNLLLAAQVGNLDLHRFAREWAWLRRQDWERVLASPWNALGVLAELQRRAFPNAEEPRG